MSKNIRIPWTYLAVTCVSEMVSKLVKPYLLSKKSLNVLVASTTHPMYNPFTTMAISVVNISNKFHFSLKNSFLLSLIELNI